MKALKALKATDYQIMRGVPVSGIQKTALDRSPLRIVTIIDEPALTASGFLLLHNKTVFFEDRIHDWEWRDGALRYYSRVVEGHADILVVYAEERIEATAEQMMAATGVTPKFDMMTGQPL